VESALRQGAGDPGLKLIETLLYDGKGFPRLHLHLDRLQGSANRLGWSCARDRAERALHAAEPQGPARMRLTLDAQGAISVTASDLPPVKPVWRLALAEGRLDSQDPWLTLKSTRRAQYDAARAGLPPGVDEVIFQNERGEVCDGTITTLFFDRGQGLRTPPRACGLLPGVLRAALDLPGEVLLAEDLPRVKLWVGNSLRGLIPADWAG
jgi:4-amino-4-deoxychorismate lyase